MRGKVEKGIIGGMGPHVSLKKERGVTP